MPYRNLFVRRRRHDSFRLAEAVPGVFLFHQVPGVFLFHQDFTRVSSALCRRMTRLLSYGSPIVLPSHMAVLRTSAGDAVLTFLFLFLSLFFISFSFRTCNKGHWV